MQPPIGASRQSVQLLRAGGLRTVENPLPEEHVIGMMHVYRAFRTSISRVHN